MLVVHMECFKAEQNWAHSLLAEGPMLVVHMECLKADQIKILHTHSWQRGPLCVVDMECFKAD